MWNTSSALPPAQLENPRTIKNSIESTANTRPRSRFSTRRLMSELENTHCVATPVWASERQIAATARFGAKANSAQKIAVTAKAQPIAR